MINLIDTIKLRFTLESGEQLKELIQWLSKNYSETYEETIKTNGLKTYKCKIRNMNLYANNIYVFITGSIHKFYLGNNFEEMKQQDIVKAFNLVSSSLGDILDIRQAHIRRLDIGVNILMDHHPTSYVNKLYSSSAKKSAYYNGQTINAGNQSRGITVYDKTAEVKKENRKNREKMNVPDNLLRLEASIKGRKVFEKRFGNQLPTVEQLLQQLNKLPDIWLDEYKQLDKEYSVNVDRVNSMKELYYYAITVTGADKCSTIVDYSYSIKAITAQDRYRFNNTIKAAFKLSTSTSKNDLMRELDEKALLCYEQAKL